MCRLITTNTETSSSTLSGITNMDVHIFLDKNGNVIQIKKEIKSKLKFYIDPVLPPDNLTICVIGVSNEFGEECTDGIAMGLNNFDKMAIAIYS